MERCVSILVIFLSLHNGCFGEADPEADPGPSKLPTGLYGGPEEEVCNAGKEINYDFTKVLVTQTTRLPAITDTITLPVEMVHISVAPVLETLTIFETETKEPVIVTEAPPPGECRPIQPIQTSLTTLELATTVTADPIIEVKPYKEIEWETVPPVTATVTVTSTIPKDTEMHMVLRHFTNTIVEPTVTIMKTLTVTTTEMLPAIIKTVRLGKTKTERASPVTEQHAPVTMMSPPEVKIYRIDITQTSIPPAVSKMVMYTTTKYEKRPCEDYHTKTPQIPFKHGGQVPNLGLPNFGS